MKTFKTICYLLIVILFSFSACKKGDKGDTGPAGTNGANGTNGTANITVRTFDVPSWLSNNSYWYIDLTDSAITSTVQSSGTVQAFFSITNGTKWSALPTTFYSSNIYWMTYVIQTNLVEVQWWYDVNVGIGSNPNTFFNVTSSQIKIVVIPPAQRLANPTVDWRNYEAIKSKFNLAD